VDERGRAFPPAAQSAALLRHHPRPQSRRPLRDSGIEWLGQIPKHWEVLQLRRVTKKFVDYRGKTPEKLPSGIPLVTARNIKKERIDFTESEEFIAEQEYDEWMGRGLPEVGDVVVTTEAPLGETAQIADARVALAQRIILLKRDASRVTNDYLMDYFSSSAARAELGSRATGSTALGIKASHFKASRIAVPPIDEQVAISQHTRY